MLEDEKKERTKKDSEKKRHVEDNVAENQILGWRSYMGDVDTPGLQFLPTARSKACRNIRKSKTSGISWYLKKNAKRLLKH